MWSRLQHEGGSPGILDQCGLGYDTRETVWSGILDQRVQSVLVGAIKEDKAHNSVKTLLGSITCCQYL